MGKTWFDYLFFCFIHFNHVKLIDGVQIITIFPIIQHNKVISKYRMIWLGNSLKKNLKSYFCDITARLKYYQRNFPMNENYSFLITKVYGLINKIKQFVNLHAIFMNYSS